MSAAQYVDNTQKIHTLLDLQQQLLALTVSLFQQDIRFAEQQPTQQHDTEAQLPSFKMNPRVEPFVVSKSSTSPPSHTASEETPLPATAIKKVGQQQKIDSDEIKHNIEATTQCSSTQKKKKKKKAPKKKPKKATAQKAASDVSAEKDLWVYLLSNAPETLVQKYPDLLERYRTQYFLGACDGDLSGLKATDLNGKPIIFIERNAQKQRFVVKVMDGSPKPRQILVREKNILCVKPEPVQRAFSDYKNGADTKFWKKYTAGDTKFNNRDFIDAFIANQMPGSPIIAETEPYISFWDEALAEVCTAKLCASEADCPIIISFLYAFSFSRKIHLRRRYLIPPSWTLKKWKGKVNIYLPLPAD